uniref:Uncharacterized protein n=1 Tax=Phaeodactylum tricornutum TaxID=2850 RepID=A0A8J9RZN5_PHATR
MELSLERGSSSFSRKRSKASAGLKEDASLCHVCQETPAAVVVRLPALRTTKLSHPQMYCLIHYYSSSAVRTDVKYVTVLDQEELNRQLPAVQELFSEAYVSLQQELSEQSARAFSRHQHDPLAILHDLNKKSRKAPPAATPKKVDYSAGGFIREVPLPERLLHTQQQQARLQSHLISRMEKASDSARPTSKISDLSRRRPSSRKSIWNVVMDQPTKKQNSAKGEISTERKKYAIHPDTTIVDDTTCSACGSHQVEIVGSNTSRNQDATKGEIWGNKDRGDETVTRYRCLNCARTWNEED